MLLEDTFFTILKSKAYFFTSIFMSCCRHLKCIFACLSKCAHMIELTKIEKRYLFKKMGDIIKSKEDIENI